MLLLLNVSEKKRKAVGYKKEMLMDLLLFTVIIRFAGTNVTNYFRIIRSFSNQTGWQL